MPEPSPPPPTWPELLGRRPSALTQAVDKRLPVRAWLLGLGMALFYPFMGCLWVVVEPFAIAGLGVALARSAHRRTWEMDPCLRLLPITPRERVAGLAAVVARFWMRVLVQPLALMFVLFVAVGGALSDAGGPGSEWVLPGTVVVFLAIGGRLALLFLLLLYATLACTQSRLAGAEGRRPSIGMVMFLGFAACMLSWLPPFMGLMMLGVAATLAGFVLGTAATGVLLWLLARSAWRSLEVACADAE